jgi:hypothetical protein
MTSAEQPDQTPPAPRLQPHLRPPGGAGAAPAAGPAARWGLRLALAVLLLLGAGVVFVLPGLLDRDVPPSQPEVTLPPSATRSAPVETDDARRQAEESLQRFLRLQAELKLLQAPDWAAAEWVSAGQQAGRGDRLFAERSFIAAAQAYAQALAGLEAIKAGRFERLAQTLAAAREALEHDDGDSAQRYFEQALLIDADNDEAQTGLARARVRARVLAFMAAAGQAEDARQLQAARAAYQQALQLDAVYTEAQQGLARVEAALDAQNFEAAMSEALTALASGRLDAAGAALDKAAAIDPQAVALEDARQRLRLARQQVLVDSLRREAAARVRAEDWEGAMERYRRALQVDANAGFARDGIARAEQRARLHRQFDHYLADPSRLYSSEPLANAEKLLSAAGAAPADEPKLRAKLARLQVLVQQARQPLPVTLRSDGETEVLIYHVGRLGRFVIRQLDLPPGSYTAVGSRAGYRDVRRVFELQPGQSSPTVDIRCEEAV